MELRDLHILLSVAQAVGMSRAADRLAISHPVVSKTITDLEHALGVRLLDRTPQGTELSSYGLALLNCGTIVFDELRRGIQEIAFLSDPTVGELQIGSAGPYIQGLIPAVIARLADRYPQIKLHVVDTDAVTLCGMLRQRKVDLVIGRVPSSIFGDALDFGISVRRAHVRGCGYHEPLVAASEKIGLAELCHEPWLLPELDNIAMALISDAFRNAGFTPPAAQVVSNSMTLRVRLVETGKFIAIVPDLNFAVWYRRMQIKKTLPIRLRMKAPSTVAMLLKNCTPNPIARLFIDELRAVVASSPKGIRSE